MLKIQLVPAPLTSGEVYIEYRTHIVQLPTEPFVMIIRLMYSASQRGVGEYSDRMHLEVGTDFFSS